MTDLPTTHEGLDLARRIDLIAEREEGSAKALAKIAADVSVDPRAIGEAVDRANDLHKAADLIRRLAPQFGVLRERERLAPPKPSMSKNEK